MLSPSVQKALNAARDTRKLALASGVVAQSAGTFREQFPGRRALVIGDSASMQAAGNSVWAAFAQAERARPDPFVFTEPNLHAEYQYVDALLAVLKPLDAVPVAVGSGTINDLTKLAAHLVRKPYMVVATAASMDGYSAYGASITRDGSKQTFNCPAPRAIVADLDILCAAPKELNAAGYADLLAKVPAGADWLLADALGLEPIHQVAWDIVQGGLRPAVSNPQGIFRGEPDAVQKLTEGLLLAGFAMQAAESSRCASGAEHQFSHLWDMQHHTHNGVTPWHGFKVGVATLAVSELYEFMLAQPLEQLDVERCVASWPRAEEFEAEVARIFPVDSESSAQVQKVALEESRAKHLDATALRAQLETIRRTWPQLRQRLQQQLIPRAELKIMLQAAGAAVEPEQIGISRSRLRHSFWQALYLRRRYTILDLAMRTGLLAPALDAMFPATETRS